MDRSKGSGGGDEIVNQIENQTESKRGSVTGGDFKGKSCKGYLYYSSVLKSTGKNPRCIGIPRTLQNVPNYIVGQSEAEASKDGRRLVDFYYGCAGYSVYVGKDHSTDKQVEKTQLPVCVGLELLVDRRVHNTETASAPAHVHSREDGQEFPLPRKQKPAQSAGDDFLIRYTRNASLVASGVARNMRKVGSYIKDSLDDILYPYRRRPK
ncbi:uncharacterized protein [Euphorbia lathyris]|uniref:uncharacterized protein n=1 Tax=Euphorbia lathyris TaxID=212925 RepID=UPI0033137E51